MADTLREKISSELKEAMKAQDKRRISTLRLMQAAIKDRDIQNRGTGKDESLTEAGVQEILAKMIKQRRDSAESYEQGGRPELAEGERHEIEIIQQFLPQQLSEEEVEAAVSGLIEELEAEGLKDMGKMMGALKERYAGQMDFSKASALVKQKLS